MHTDNNQVLITGTVISVPEFDHSLYGDRFYTMDISVPRLSGTEDIIPVTISERLFLDDVPQIGNDLMINGQLRSYNKMLGGQNRLVITVFAKNLDYASEECEYLNDITLCGYICKPIIYRTTPFSREIADILLAVNRAYGKSDYLPCIAWGRNARYASELPVGELLRIEGRVQSRKYQKLMSDGTVSERVAYEVSCSSIETYDKELVK